MTKRPIELSQTFVALRAWCFVMSRIPVDVERSGDMAVRMRARGMLGPADSQGRESRLARRGADVPELPPAEGC